MVRGSMHWDAPAGALLALTQFRPGHALLHAPPSSHDANREALQRRPAFRSQHALTLRFSVCLVPCTHRPSRQRCPRYLPTASRAAPLSSSHPAQGIDSARACTPTTHTPNRAHRQLPNHTPRLGTRFGIYTHTPQVHRELFPPSYRPPCLSPSKSLTPQSAPSTRAAARLYVLQSALLHLSEKTPANHRLSTAKNCASHAEPGRISPRHALHPALLTPQQFKENPDAWLLVDKILQDAQYPQTKCKWVAGQWPGCHAANIAQTWDCRFSTMSS
jgi:hypothetical protein